MLVEPSRTQAGIVKKYLKELQVERVHTATSGAEALELARQQRADVLLSAMHLPDMPGPRLAEALLADPGCPAAGFVLATSEADAGADAPSLPDSPRAVLLLKPFDLRTLAQSLAHAAGAAVGAVPG